MDALKSAARARLAELESATAAQVTAGEIERASFEVRVGPESETVSLRLRGGKLQTSCSCGTASCAHLRGALQLMASNALVLAVDSQGTSRSLAPNSERTSLPPDRRPPRGVRTAAGADTAALCEALDEVITAIVRNGIANPSAASVQDTLSRLTAALPSPTRVPMCRFVGRLRQAIEARDVGACAQLLWAASQWVEDVRTERNDADARVRACAWSADDTQGLERVSDRRLLEFARETVHGLERTQLERRYLMDLSSGEVLREDCLRRAHAGSIGPCPRLVSVSLAELFPGSPRCARVLQYAVSADIDHASWHRFAGWATRDLGEVVQRYRSELERFAGLHEPFVVMAPAALAREAQLALVDAQGRTLALIGDDDSGVLRRFEELTATALPAWVAGRLVDRHGHVMLRPLSLGILDGERLRHERL